MTVPSIPTAVAEVPLELKVRDRGPLLINAWVSRVSPGPSKILARPGEALPVEVVITAKLCGCGAGPVTGTGVTTGR